MKHFFKLLPICFYLISFSNLVLAQDTREAQIRRLENLEREAVLKSDSSALYGKLWSPTMVVNTPANVVGTIEGTKAQLRACLNFT